MFNIDVADTIHEISPALNHLKALTTLRGRYAHPCSADEEMEIERLDHLLKGKQPLSRDFKSNSGLRKSRFYIP